MPNTRIYYNTHSLRRNTPPGLCALLIPDSLQVPRATVCLAPLDRLRRLLADSVVIIMFTSAVTITWIAVAAAAVVLSTHTVEADADIKCYVCNSHNDTDCAKEKLPEHFKTECSKLNTDSEYKNYTLCRKIIQTIEPEVNGLQSDKNRVIRTCGWDTSNYNNKCYHRSGFGGKQDVCTCMTDYCNMAQKTYTAFATVMAALFAILIL